MDNNTVIFCGLMCRKKYIKKLKKSSSSSPKRNRSSWTNDGPDPSLFSIAILIERLTTPGNYSRWKGGDDRSGETKTTMAGKIAQFMKSKGIVEVKEPRVIIRKIGWLETQLKIAHEFLQGTGAGITDEKDLTECILKRCRYYYKLEDVMLSRASIQPLALNPGALLDGDNGDGFPETGRAENDKQETISIDNSSFSKSSSDSSEVENSEDDTGEIETSSSVPNKRSAAAESEVLLLTSASLSKAAASCPAASK